MSKVPFAHLYLPFNKRICNRFTATAICSPKLFKMKKLLQILFIFCSIDPNILQAQSPSFHSTLYGNIPNIRENVKGFDFDQAMDSSYIVAGAKTTNFFTDEFYLYHFTKTGSIDWIKTITTQYQQNASGVIRIKALRGKSAGINEGYIGVLNEGGSLFVFRLNASGGITWTKEIKGIGYIVDLDIEPVYTTKGVVASYNILTHYLFDEDTKFLQLSSTGSLLFAKKITSFSLQFHGMTVSNTGGWLCMGEYFLNNKSYPALMHLNSAGVVQWCRYYKLSNDAFDYSSCINRVQDGYILGVRYKKNGVEDNNALIKTDFNGSIVWTNHYNYTGSNPMLAYPVSISVNSSQEIVIANSDRLNDKKNCLIKLSSAGNMVWARDYTGNPSTDYFVHGIKSFKGFAFLVNDKVGGTDLDKDMKLINTGETGTSGTYCNANNVVVQSYTTPLKQSISITDFTLTNMRLYSFDAIITLTNSTLNNIKCLSLPMSLNAHPEKEIGVLSLKPSSSGLALQVTYNKKTEIPQSFSVKVYTKDGQLAGEGVIQNNKPLIIELRKSNAPFLFVKLWHNGLPEAEQKIAVMH